MLAPASYPHTEEGLAAMHEAIDDGFEFIGSQIDVLHARHREMREVLEMVETYLNQPADRDQLKDGQQRVALLMAVNFALRRW